MAALPGPGPHVLDDAETSADLEKRYHLVLLDDDEHSYQYVIVMLGKIFGYAVEKSFAIACAVDQQGSAIVLTGTHDEVRRKQDQIHGFGADPFMESCKGSMSAVIEAAE